MSQKTIIAWTDHTFNAWWGCVKVSEGCKNCYADALSQFYGWKEGGHHRQKLWGPNSARREFGEKHWKAPHEWNKAAQAEGRHHRVFCGSMMDWAEDHPSATAIRPRLWESIRATPWLDWQLLTKRPQRIRECLPSDWGGGYANVWLGTSVENMKVAERVDHLRDIPAVVRFISYEPALGPLDDLNIAGIDWIIYGGESGPGYRAHDLAWPRAMRAKCKANGTAFFYKQSAAPRTEMGTTLDGETVRHYPTPRVPAFAPSIRAIVAA
jgi:protein gp37